MLCSKMLLIAEIEMNKNKKGIDWDWLIETWLAPLFLIAAVLALIFQPFKSEVLMPKLIEKDKWEECIYPECKNSGSYPVSVDVPEFDGDGVITGHREDFEQQQCEWCWSNPNGVFNQSRWLKDPEINPDLKKNAD